MTRTDLNGKGNEVFIETLEITHEGLERASRRRTLAWTSDSPDFRTEIEFTLPRGFIDEAGVRPPPRQDAARDRRGRDLAAARPTGAGEPGLPNGHYPRPRHRQGSERCPGVDTHSHRRASLLPILNTSAGYMKTINALDEPEGAPTVAANGAAAPARRSSRPGGSLMAYPVAELYGEIAFIAAHFHWSRESLFLDGARRAPALVPRDFVHQQVTRPQLGRCRKPLRRALNPRCAPIRMSASASRSASTRCAPEDSRG